MKKVLSTILLLFSIEVAQAASIPVNVYAYSESVGKKINTWTPSDSGYMAWMEGGYKKLGCFGPDFSHYYQTPCMIRVLFQTMSGGLSDLNLDVDFAYNLKYVDFDGYDVECKTSRCIPEMVRQWQEKNPAPGIDVLLFPRRDSVWGHTRTVANIKTGKTVMGIVAGKTQSYALVDLFRHEMSHALGFAMHLYDSEPWTFNADLAYKCPSRVVVPYEQSGLPRGCQNMTPLGSHIKPGEICQAINMDDPKIEAVKFNVPLYGDHFKAVFGCWLAENTGAPVPVPVPTPVPVPPKPTPIKVGPACQLVKDLAKQINCKL